MLSKYKHKDVNKTNNVICMLQSLTENSQDCSNQKAEFRSCKLEVKQNTSSEICKSFINFIFIFNEKFISK